MTVDVIFTAQDVTPERVSGRTVAVIDVFRATTVVVRALAEGARAVVPVRTIEDARLMAEKYPLPLLAGERSAFKPEGFDVGNSPLSFNADTVRGKTVVLTTTNGTQAILNSRHSHKILIAAFVNIDALCAAVAEQQRDAVLVCSGRYGRFTAEDGACAGAIASQLRGWFGFGASDAALAMECYYLSMADHIQRGLSATAHYHYLQENGFSEDIKFCLKQNLYLSVPFMNLDGEIINQ